MSIPQGATPTSLPTTLAGVLWPARGREAGIARAIILAFAGSMLLWVSAKVQVPFYPVPMTLQSLAVLMIGAAYGWRLGAATVALYLLEGALGLPVFASGGGLHYFVGPTAGYLFGFVIGAAVIGWLAERGWDRSLPLLLVAMTIGHVLLFVPGYLWLAHLFGSQKAWLGGVQPFLWATLFKTALGGCLMPAIWSVLARWR
jgi:biotin transport system substrate-specific component